MSCKKKWGLSKPFLKCASSEFFRTKCSLLSPGWDDYTDVKVLLHRLSCEERFTWDGKSVSYEMGREFHMRREERFTWDGKSVSHEMGREFHMRWEERFTWDAKSVSHEMGGAFHMRCEERFTRDAKNVSHEMRRAFHMVLVQWFIL